MPGASNNYLFWTYIVSSINFFFKIRVLRCYEVHGTIFYLLFYTMFGLLDAVVSINVALLL